MKVLISGGTGFIGCRVAARFSEAGADVGVYTRKPAGGRRSGVTSHFWDPLGAAPAVESLDGADAVIHLAGETVAQRWNPEVKRRIRDSRVVGTRNLVESIGRAAKKPKTLVSASAIGIYGDRGDEILTEGSAPGNGFLCGVCRDWEAEADRAAQFGVRVVKLRIGFVLGRDGCALKEMLPAFRLGAGGRLGFSGRQWMPWIHLDDLIGLIYHAAANEAVSGVWNATAPNPVRNRDFTVAMGAALHRPAVIPVPVLALKLLFGELAQHMLDSARVVPQAAERAGYRFQYPEVGPALRNLIG